jgi:2-furoyl-CoA dehydrogenase large subunit
MLLDADVLGALIPGCQGIDRESPTHFRADVLIGIGPVKGRYRADIALSDLDPPHAVTLTGSAIGALGFGRGTGRILLAEARGATRLQYEYTAYIGGKLAAVGDRLLDGAARLLIGQFFLALRRRRKGRPLGLFGRLQAALRRRR